MQEAYLVFFLIGRPIAELGSLCNFLLPFGDVVLTGGQLGIVFDAISGKRIHQHRSPLNCGAAQECEKSVLAEFLPRYERKTMKSDLIVDFIPALIKLLRGGY